MKKNGFISMSVVYSFFLVFITVATLLLANYIQNRLLIREINTDIKNELSNTGNSKVASFTNLIANGDAELEANWVFSSPTIISYNEVYYSSALHSIELAIPPSSTTVTLSQQLTQPLIPGNQYYLRLEVFAPWTTTGTSSIIRLRNATTGSVVSTTLTTFNSTTGFTIWTPQSQIITIPTTATEGDTWHLEIIETNKSGSPIYLDNFLLIDLTTPLGTDLTTYSQTTIKTWVDTNVPFFSGTSIYNRTYQNNHLD